MCESRKKVDNFIILFIKRLEEETTVQIIAFTTLIGFYQGWERWIKERINSECILIEGRKGDSTVALIANK